MLHGVMLMANCIQTIFRDQILKGNAHARKTLFDKSKVDKKYVMNVKIKLTCFLLPLGTLLLIMIWRYYSFVLYIHGGSSLERLMLMANCIQTIFWDQILKGNAHARKTLFDKSKVDKKYVMNVKIKLTCFLLPLDTLLLIPLEFPRALFFQH